MEKLNNYNFFTQNELKLELVTEYIENHEKLPDSKVKKGGGGTIPKFYLLIN